MNIYISSDMMKLVEKSEAIGLDRSVFVIEECAELIKELTKQQRYQHGDNSHSVAENKNHIFEESCDIISTVLQMLYAMGYNERKIMDSINFKCRKALDRELI